MPGKENAQLSIAERIRAKIEEMKQQAQIRIDASREFNSTPTNQQSPEVWKQLAARSDPFGEENNDG